MIGGRLVRLARPRERAHRRRARAAAAPAPVLGAVLLEARRIALWAISGLVAAASLVSFGESYRGLWEWARHHGLGGFWAAVWPLQVDVFIAVGELSLFVGLAYAWRGRSRLAGWAVTLLGLAVSVAGNVGHVAGHSPTNRATAAVPPVAAAAALAVGLGVLKRVIAAQPPGESAETAADKLAPAILAFRASVAGGNPLSERALADRFGITRADAKQIRTEVAMDASQNGHP